MNNMIVYLDQNKWIELAKIVYGKDESSESQMLLNEIKIALNSDSMTLPLSCVHYQETIRNRNRDSRRKLGNVMWRFSRGARFASFRDIVIHEVEIAFSKYFPEIKPQGLKLIGRGMEHAFGFYDDNKFSPRKEREFEKALLTGESLHGVLPSSFNSIQPRESFSNFLKTLTNKNVSTPINKMDAWLKITALHDVKEPISEVFKRNGLSEKDIQERLQSLDMIEMLISEMPSRKMDYHLMRQVLKNSQYKPKLNDLDDWSGIGLASQYCDVVICENHLADMMQRESFVTKARVETKLQNLFLDINDLTEISLTAKKRRRNIRKRKRKK